MDPKVLIVEGSRDRKRLIPILAEPVEIICTNGTISPYRLEELLAPYEGRDLYVFMDADDPGDSNRKLFKQLFPEAKHLYTDRFYGEVEATPEKLLASILVRANFEIHPEYLAGGPLHE